MKNILNAIFETTETKVMSYLEYKNYVEDMSLHSSLTNVEITGDKTFTLKYRFYKEVIYVYDYTV